MSSQEIRQVSLKNYYDVYLGRRDAVEWLLYRLVDEMRSLQFSLDDASLTVAVARACQKFPFIKLVYVLNDRGIQISQNILVGPDCQVSVMAAAGQDRSSRPYFDPSAVDIVITDPYISLADKEICLSVASHCPQDAAWMVIDCNLTEMLGCM